MLLPPPPAPVYADEHLLAFDKPAGLLAVPGRGPDKADCLSARVQAVWPGALIVHRLDEATSGLILMARSPRVQRLLGEAFAQRRVRKRYEAVVCASAAAVHTPCGWTQPRAAGKTARRGVESVMRALGIARKASKGKRGQMRGFQTVLMRNTH